MSLICTYYVPNMSVYVQDVASRVAGALQKAKNAENEPVSFA